MNSVILTGRIGKDLELKKTPSEKSVEGNLVLDPFIVSGTTAIVCLNTDRQYIGFELDETYYKLSLEHIKNHIATEFNLKQRKENE